MNPIKFRKFSLDDQLIMVMNHGVLLMQCKRYNLKLRLFALENFYVEVVSNSSTKEVITITSYEDLDSLDHILSEIDISGVLS